MFKILQTEIYFSILISFCIYHDLKTSMRILFLDSLSSSV